MLKVAEELQRKLPNASVTKVSGSIVEGNRS